MQVDRPAVGSNPRSAYIHLPFCKRRCHYCDFPIQVLGAKHTDVSANTISNYIQLLCMEIENTPRLGDRPLSTVFFGGGTPSLIPPAELESIIQTLRHQFGFDEEMEMSMEADPGTFDSAKMQSYLSLGVNRISLGVQSFTDDILQICGRSHSVADIWSAIDIIQTSNIPSWSMDLISGLPFVTIEAWKSTLDTTVSCQPDHVSIYDLQVEPFTLFSRRYEVDKQPLPSHEVSAEMYALASQMLKIAGYEHYEISNYAKAEHRCRHNMTYWMNNPFYGFGLGAASYLLNKRLTRPKKMHEYKDWVESRLGTLEQTHIPVTTPPPIQSVLPNEADSERDIMFDTLMLQFRLKDGIDLAKFSAEYGSALACNLQSALDEEYKRGLIERLDQDNELISNDGSWNRVVRVRLSDPKGFLMSNDVLSNIFNKL